MVSFDRGGGLADKAMTLVGTIARKPSERAMAAHAGLRHRPRADSSGNAGGQLV